MTVKILVKYSKKMIQDGFKDPSPITAEYIIKIEDCIKDKIKKINETNNE
jgi:hypothetical protein